MNKALVEQAGGDERAAFEAWATHLPMDRQPLRPDLYMPQTQWAWEAWQFRAALAQPSPKCATCNGSKVVSTTDTDHNGDHIEAPCPKCGGTGEADSGGVHPWGEPVLIPCDCETEQAEAERPEVVARVVHSNPAVLGQCGPLNANDELMTVAQHAASVARWAEMFNRVEQQRDAALARVAELEHVLRVVVNAADHGSWPTTVMHGIEKVREVLAGSAPPAQAQHSVPEISGIGRDAEHPRAVVLYMRNEPSDEDMRAIQNSLRAMPADVSAKAQHSVPEGWKLVPIEPLLNMMSDKDHDTRITAERQLLSILAAAPGKEVGHE
ncbi:hypothetical protein R0C86_001184 [Pseudomonas aeruginosa]|nr:hypothetical protein [Pseudomonas aeruginosa]